MRDTWILDVLADLRSFAEGNDLPDLARQLTVTRQLALRELSARAAPGARTRVVRPDEG